MNVIDIDQMVESYIEYALWTSCHYENEEDCGTYLDKLDYELSDEARKQMHEDCADFLELIEREGIDLDGKIDCVQMGHDFWLTRNGHGAGFWDRDLGELGDRLTELCRPYGSCDLYVGDDNLIYCQ